MLAGIVPAPRNVLFEKRNREVCRRAKKAVNHRLNLRLLGREYQLESSKRESHEALGSEFKGY